VRGQRVDASAAQRFDAITDYHGNRIAAADGAAGSYRPLAPDALYLKADDWAAAVRDRPIHLVTPFDAPDAPGVIDMNVHAARDFAPERAADANVYALVAAHLAAEQRAGRRTIIASYSQGARDRLAGLLREHGAAGLVEVDGWQAALGAATPRPGAANPATALIVLPIDSGFVSDGISLLSEQDILGERLVRRAKRRKSADAFLAELATLGVGDLVVHLDHGIGRYEGLTSIPVGQARMTASR
jgi:transcription-repair coupling factor (superfamily II helicase)